MKSTHSSKKLLIIIGASVLGAAALAGAVVWALAANGVFDKKQAEEPQCEHPTTVQLGTEVYKTCEDPYGPMEDKPIIYLYPEEETELKVKLGAPERITTSYPKYTDGWDVVAYPNGDLVDKATGNKLYSLYWEGESKEAKKLSSGFVIKGEDSAKFLEEKLDILGLNYKEKEEFIVYWLPKLEAHKYNHIYFEETDAIEEDMPLELSARPDTIIRVRMLFEGLDDYKEVPEQKLAPAPARTGFMVVEWGGSELGR